MRAQSHSALFDVAVAGRGAVGLAAALGLGRAGLRVALVGPAESVGGEPAAAPAGDWDNRVFALSGSSRSLLESLGVWQAMDANRIAPVHDMRIWPASPIGDPGRPIHFSAWESGVQALAWIVENRNLVGALSQACRFAGFPTHDSPLERLDRDSDPSAARLVLADGRELRARLVVGADGASSRVRELSGLRSDFLAYPQRAIVANFDTALPHRDCALQWFGSHGVLALLPLPAQRVDAAGHVRGRCSVVWSAPLELAAELERLDAEHLARRVEEACAGALGRMVPVGQAASWPLRLGRVESTTTRRVVLVGDAAHVVHPLAGQGLNLGLGDVRVLAQVLQGRESPRDPGEHALLRRHERARAEPVMRMRLATDGLHKLFDRPGERLPGLPGAALTGLRDLGWRAVAASGALRRWLIAGAAL